MGWSADAEGLRADDKEVLETGKTLYVHEYAHIPGRGKVTLNVCKFVGEFDGKKGAFGIRSLSTSSRLNKFLIPERQVVSISMRISADVGRYLFS